MTMQAIPTTSRPRIGEVQVLSSLARASPAMPIGIVADRDPEGELERAVGEVAPAEGRQRAEQEVADITPKIADDRGERGQLHRS